MGSLQTFFYLALISAVMIGVTLLFVGIVAFGLVRWFRQARGQTPLTFWLISGAVTVVLLFIVLGTAGDTFVGGDHGTPVEVPPGAAAFVPASAGRATVAGPGEVFIAAVPA